MAARGSLRSGRAPVTCDRIIDAAVALLDDEGIGRLTMRRPAEQLGAAPSTLYWHVETKDDVIAPAVDAIFGEVTVPVDMGRTGKLSHAN